MPLAHAFVHPTAQIGVPFRPLQGFIKCDWELSTVRPALPSKIYVGAFAIVGEGVALGERVIIDDYCKVGSGATLGDDVLVIYRATIGGMARVGARSIIGGTVSEYCDVGKECRIFGRIIHKHADSIQSWDHSEPEPSVTIMDHTFIGFDAVVMGNIGVGPRAYICANSIVTRSVPPFHIAYGANRQCHFSEWKGSLRHNPLFSEE